MCIRDRNKLVDQNVTQISNESAIWMQIFRIALSIKSAECKFLQIKSAMRCDAIAFCIMRALCDANALCTLVVNTTTHSLLRTDKCLAPEHVTRQMIGSFDYRVIIWLRTLRHGEMRAALLVMHMRHGGNSDIGATNISDRPNKFFSALRALCATQHAFLHVAMCVTS